MRYMVIWQFRPNQADEATARFADTGGLPPEGVTMTGRWHDVGGHRGWAIAESDDPTAVAKWCRKWTDLLSFQIVPVLNDEEIGEVLAEPRT